jgi:selenocysteine-specific translation elongation factor
MTFELRVTDMFDIKERGTVFSGTISSGKISVGDRIRIKSPLAVADLTVLGLLQHRVRLSEAGAGDEIGVLASPFDLELVADGFRRIDDGCYEIISLTLVDSPPKWWKIWRYRKRAPRLRKC